MQSDRPIDRLTNVNHYTLDGDGKPIQLTPVETTAKGAINSALATVFDRSLE